MANKVAFVAWSLSQRSKVLAHFLKADIITYKKIYTNPLLKLLHYKLLSFLTLMRLCCKKYDLVFVQIPPFHAALITFLYSKIAGKKLIFDTHSAIFLPKGIHQHLYFTLYCYMIKHIKLNIVHNKSILNRDCLKNSRSVLLEPFNPSIRNQSDTLLNNNHIAMICSYDKDEPITEMINTAKLLPEYKFHLTGNHTKAKTVKDNIPGNLVLTGYLSDNAYIDLLCKMEIIIALTTRPETVLNGAYEAVSLAKPLITSDTPTLRSHFNKGTVFTQNNAQAIAESIIIVKKNINRLQTEISELRKEKEETWKIQFAVIEEYLTQQ